MLLTYDAAADILCFFDDFLSCHAPLIAGKRCLLLR